VQRFLVHEHRDAQPGLLDRPFLRGVDVARGSSALRLAVPAAAPARRSAWGDAAAVIGREIMPRPLGKFWLALAGSKSPVGVWIFSLCSQIATSLRDLLLQRHALEQILDACLDRLRGVLVERLVGLGLWRLRQARRRRQRDRRRRRGGDGKRKAMAAESGA
jgi:hypothetical protein